MPATHHDLTVRTGRASPIKAAALLVCFSLAAAIAAQAAGRVFAWGSNSSGQCNVPPGLNNAVAIAAGLYHSVALRTNGTVIAWGGNTSGPTNVPPGLDEVVALAAGDYHTAALTRAGRVAVWGSYAAAAVTNVPSNVSNIIALASGANHLLALREDGRLIAWGSGAATNTPASLSNAVAMAGGAYHSVALRSDGTVVTWGLDVFGVTKMPAGLSDVVGIACGLRHTVALRGDGTIVAWGENSRGQTNVPTGLADVIGIGTGGYHSFALLQDGTVAGWGWNSYGQLSVPGGLANLACLTGGDRHTLALEGDGRPQFAVEPFDRTVSVGNSVTLRAGATGVQPLIYQWTFEGTALAGATNPALTIAATEPSHAGHYSCMVSSALGTATSRPALLTVTECPALAEQPTSQTVVAGATVTFIASAAGAPPLRYQWRKNGEVIEGETGPLLVFEQVRPTDGGEYSVLVSNACGVVISEAALLTVTWPLLQLANVWHYDQSGLNLGTAWKETNFNDSAWPSGAGVLAVEDNAAIVPLVQTTLSLSNAARQRIITYYFRTHFTFDDDPALFYLTTSNLVDDGAVVYLNGQEEYRLNLPSGPIGFTTLASQPVTPVEGVFEPLSFSAAHLQRGDNVLAVEVHQVNSTSSDVVFGLSLDAHLRNSGPVRVVVQPQSLSLPAGLNAVFSVLVAGQEPLSCSWQKNGAPLAANGRFTGVGTTELTIANLRVADAGDYSVVVSNASGCVTSAVATLSVYDYLPLLQFTNVWRYNQSGLDLGSAWKETNFNDAAWSQGAGALGVDTHTASFIRTPLALSNAAGARIITYYLRTHFTFAEDPVSFYLTATNLLDDGAVVYLNGREVYRLNMPKAPVSASTLSLLPAPEPWFAPVSFPSTCLNRGGNVLAVEVHQASTNSSDVVWALSLDAHLCRSSPATVVVQPEGQCIPLGSNVTFRVVAVGEEPLTYQWQRGGTNLTEDARVSGVTTPHLSITSIEPGDLGEYSVVVQNARGSNASEPAALWFPPPTFRWSESAGGAGTEDVHDTAVDRWGNIYVTGSFFATCTWGTTNVASSGADDLYLAKYSSDGRFQWVQTAGGSGSDYGGGVAVDANGNCYLSGHFSGNTIFGTTNLSSAGNYDIFIAKFSPEGRLLWVRRAGGSQYDVSWSTAVDPTGGCFVTGNFVGTATFGSQSLTSAGSDDVYLARYDADGNVLWALRGGGTGSDHGAHVAVDPQGAAYVTGWFAGTATFSGTTLTSAGSSDVFIAKYDANGSLVWLQAKSGTRGDVGKSIAIDTNGNCYVLSIFDANELSQPPRLVVSQYDATGALRWEREAYSVFYSGHCSIAADGRGCYVTGGFRSTATFGPVTLISAGDQDVFIASYDPDGSLKWAQRAGGSTADFGAGITAGQGGEISLCGWFTGVGNFGTNALTSRGSQDLFVGRLADPFNPALFRFDPATCDPVTGAVRVRLRGLSPTRPTVLFVSTNLVRWEVLQTNRLAVDRLEMTFPPPHPPVRFFRALVVPE